MSTGVGVREVEQAVFQGDARWQPAPPPMAGVGEVERAIPKVVMRRSDPWTAILVFGCTLTTVAVAEALLVIDRGWGVDIWTVVNHSSSQARSQLADKQWNFMQVFPDLDVDFHILDRRGEPLESFICPSDYDVFIRLKANAYSGSTSSTG